MLVHTLMYPILTTDNCRYKTSMVNYSNYPLVLSFNEEGYLVEQEWEGPRGKSVYGVSVVLSISLDWRLCYSLVIHDLFSVCSRLI